MENMQISLMFRKNSKENMQAPETLAIAAKTGGGGDAHA
jgi:hypothetical protein